MFIPKKNSLELMLKRKSISINFNSDSNSNNNNNNKINRHHHWSDICAEFIKEIVFKRKNSICDENNNQHFSNTSNLCLDQLSEFQKSYVSFPEFSDSNNESDNDSYHTNNASSNTYWLL